MKTKQGDRKKRARIIYSSTVLLLTSFLVLGYFFIKQPVAIKQPTEEKKTVTGKQHISVGTKLRDVTFVDQQGVTQSLYKIINGRQAFIYLYSGCCKHCNKMLPDVARLTDDFDDKKHVILGIQYAGGKVCTLTEQHSKQIGGMLITDAGGKICGLFGVGDFTVIIADKNQTIIYRGNFMDSDNVMKKNF